VTCGGQLLGLVVWSLRERAPNLSTFAWSQRHHKVKVIGVVFDDPVSDATAFQKYYGSLYPPSLIQSDIANSYASSLRPPPS